MNRGFFCCSECGNIIIASGHKHPPYCCKRIMLFGVTKEKAMDESIRRKVYNEIMARIDEVDNDSK